MAVLRQKVSHLEEAVSFHAQALASQEGKIQDLQLRERDMNGEVRSIRDSVTAIREAMNEFKHDFQAWGQELEQLRTDGTKTREQVIRIQVLGGIAWLCVQGAALFVLKIMADNWLQHAVEFHAK